MFAWMANILSVIYTTLLDCAALDYAQTTTDITLEQQIKIGQPWEFSKMANLLALFYVVYSYTILK